MQQYIGLFLAFAISASSALTINGDYKPNLLEVAQSLNLTSFLDLVNQCGLHKVINHEGPFTVFAPSNEAFAREKWYPGEDSVCDKVYLHIGRGQVKSSEIVDENTIKSLLSKRTIRLNIYPNSAVTANGRKIIATDYEARNGVLHILGDVMSSVYKRAGSVISEIDECCPEHSEIVELVKLAGLYNTLDTQGPFTLLAPNNGAFANLHPDFINHLKKNKTALAGLLSAHVLPLTYYSVGLDNGMVIKTLAGNKITVTLTDTDVKFGKATVTLADVTAGNGAVHAIDQVLFPSLSFDDQILASAPEEKKAMNLIELLQHKGYTSFAAALKETKMDKVVDHEGHFTIFAPTNEAFEHPKAYPQHTTLLERVSLHIARGLLKESMIEDELKVPTLLSKRKLTFNVYSNEKDSIKTCSGQEIVFKGFKAHNGIIHELKSGLDFIPPRHAKLHDILKALPQFQSFVRLFDKFYPNLLEQPPAFTMTLLVPTNSVIEQALSNGIKEEDLARRLLLNHILPTSWYSIGLRSGIFSLGGKQLQVTSINTDTYSAFLTVNNNVQVTMADFSAENGVFHQVNGIIE